MTRFKNIQGQILATTPLHAYVHKGQTVILQATTITKEYTILSTAIVVSKNSIVHDVVLEEKK